MNIIPPNIRYSNKTYVDNRITSKARSLYSMFVNQLSLGGINHIQRRVTIGEYLIEFIIKKDSNYGFINGVIDISYVNIIPTLKELEGDIYVSVDMGLSIGRPISAIFSDTPELLNYFSDHSPSSIFGGVFNVRELEKPVVDPICISYRYSDTEEIINYTGSQSLWEKYNAIGNPNVGAMCVYRGVRYWSSGAFCLDARVKNDLIYILAGWPGDQGYVRLYVTPVLEYVPNLNVDVSNSIIAIEAMLDSTIDIGGTVFTTSQDRPQIIDAKISPECDEISFLCQNAISGVTDDDSIHDLNNIVYNFYNISASVGIDLENGLSENNYVIVDNITNNEYLGEELTISNSYENLAISDIESPRSYEFQVTSKRYPSGFSIKIGIHYNEDKDSNNYNIKGFTTAELTGGTTSSIIHKIGTGFPVHSHTAQEQPIIGSNIQCSIYRDEILVNRIGYDTDAYDLTGVSRYQDVQLVLAGGGLPDHWGRIDKFHTEDTGWIPLLDKVSFSSFNHEGATYPDQLFGNYTILREYIQYIESLANVGNTEIGTGVISRTKRVFEKYVVNNGVSRKYSSEEVISDMSDPYFPFGGTPIFPYTGESIMGPAGYNSGSIEKVTNSAVRIDGDRNMQGFRFSLQENVDLVCTSSFVDTGDFVNTQRNELWLENPDSGDLLLNITSLHTPEGFVNINNIDHINSRIVCGASFAPR